MPPQGPPDHGQGAANGQWPPIGQRLDRCFPTLRSFVAAVSAPLIPTIFKHEARTSDLETPPPCGHMNLNPQSLWISQPCSITGGNPAPLRRTVPRGAAAAGGGGGPHAAALRARPHPPPPVRRYVPRGHCSPKPFPRWAAGKKFKLLPQSGSYHHTSPHFLRRPLPPPLAQARALFSHRSPTTELPHASPAHTSGSSTSTRPTPSSTSACTVCRFSSTPHYASHVGNLMLACVVALLGFPSGLLKMPAQPTERGSNGFQSVWFIMPAAQSPPILGCSIIRHAAGIVSPTLGLSHPPHPRDGGVAARIAPGQQRVLVVGRSAGRHAQRLRLRGQQPLREHRRQTPRVCGGLEAFPPSLSSHCVCVHSINKKAPQLVCV